MSDYPRADAHPAAFPPFVVDRVFAVIKVAVSLWATFSYFTAFHARWERFAPDLSIFAYAPPLGEHLTSQIAAVAHTLFVGAGLWWGRGWAFAWTLVAGLSACVLALVIHRSTLGLVLFGAFDLPAFLYCGLRLIGTVGPPTGGLELRRRIRGR